MLTRLAVPALLVTAIAAAPSSAATTTYTRLADFLAAAPEATVLETFSGREDSGANAPGQVIAATGFNGFSISGNRNGDYFGISHGFTDGNIDGTFFLSWAGIDTHVGPTFTFVFDDAVTAFGFDYNDRDGSDRYGIELSSGETFDAPPFAAFTGAGFFGLRSTSAFTSVTFRLANAPGGILQSFGLDNVRTGSNLAAVPEPSSWAMMIAGFGLAGFGLRHRAGRSVRVLA